MPGYDGHAVYTFYLDNGGDSGSGYYQEIPVFTWRLQGPFSTYFQTGFHLFPLSVPEYPCVLVLFTVFLFFFLSR